jgi:hypothetical protein
MDVAHAEVGAERRPARSRTTFADRDFQTDIVGHPQMLALRGKGAVQTANADPAHVEEI